MKVAYCSDLHLNFGTLILNNDQNAEILILAGDVMEADDQKSSPVYNNFFDHVSKEFNLVFYVAGNHEYWGGNIRKTLDSMRKSLPENVIILDNEGYNIHRVDGSSVVFFGGTMWTNLGKRSPTSMMMAQRMKDFQYISYSDQKSAFWSRDESGKRVRMYREWAFGVNDWINEHDLFVEKLTERIHGTDDVVVISHHAPSSLSVSPMFKSQIFENDSYYSDMSELILDNPQIKHWVHGHIHHKQMHYIGDCLVRANPRGYYGYEQTHRFEMEYFDI